MEISKIIEKNKNSIIFLEVLIPKENNQAARSIRGTGFIVSRDGKFITNVHVLKQIPDNERQYLRAMVPGEIDQKGVLHYDGYKIEPTGKLDEENDIALMKIISSNRVFKPITTDKFSESINEGDDIVFLGHPLGTELLIMGFGITMLTNHCIISAVKRKAIDGSLYFFMVDTHINNGSSGSPVFSLKTGKVIGIASGRISAKIPLSEGKVADIPANMGICRPSKYIVDLIKNN